MRGSIIFFFFVFTFNLFATPQQSDFLYYKGKKFMLSTGWGHPSPLETYYSQKQIKYPFEMLHTANYRGHIATWIIENDRFYLKEISIQEKEFLPNDFDITSNQNSSEKNVFADWFSGIIECNLYDTSKIGDIIYIDRSKLIDTYYFHIRHGEVIEELLIHDDIVRDMATRDRILRLYENYIAYYFRLNASDSIIYQNKAGYLNGNRGISPLLELFSNDHMKWPFNWENLKRSGAPNCKWMVENDSLFLVDIHLNTGLSYDSVTRIEVELNELFNNPDNLRNVFGDWISGVYLVKYGNMVQDKNNYERKKFEVSEYSFLRIKGGIVTEKWIVPGNFKFNKLKKNIDPGLKKILDDYNYSNS
jgi:hypothetical protein